ncbi:helix-turn-helix domain-containing protein [Listeria cossartiae subsp. cayugensis]|uniref:helix-turn-helix domain-containing protein n=1 Tax=Listeria cossartiae TaxID=2838249 RepID=UPI0028806494|nr:helix-turn-helix domain-containing protein [Listeria cossartiae]MDS9999810.1 helix-turn-helix domain-containing protein [Listeria cossartiae subsp. cayugensis]MDT0003018.1 helix-turn-helix domain-containing protein [Listeria cossartiae subsp. cayugensis]MDT0007743.1 helix-turn-helix domain-containing protein [Listeria cossartiae subsp. cayugensis]MDT0018614.1 helix-turn-helix domain-containing protein [Listeria cossartiae subsp. cayugensis]MDT0029842.1 helix-turn-helix domain-containing pro
MTELGDKLKQARREKGLSLDDLQQITKIQKRYLVAIEEGNYAVMPGKFYARAFIKQYAEAVGLDSTTLFDEFESEVPETPQQEVVNNEPTRVQSKRNPIPAQAVGNQSNARNRFFDILPKILIALFIVFILFIVWFFLLNKQDNSTEKVKTDTSNPTVKVEDSTKNEDTSKDTEKKDTTSDEDKSTEKTEDTSKEVEVTKGETSGNATTYTVKNTDKMTLSLSATGDSWIGVSDANGSTIQNITLSTQNPSTEIDLGDNKTVSIVIGNSPVTTVKINGKELELAPDLVKQVLTINLEASDTSSDAE